MSSSRKRTRAKPTLPSDAAPAASEGQPSAPAAEALATPELTPALAASRPVSSSSFVVVSQGEESEDRVPALPFLIAGIGVPWNGLDTLRELFQTLPPQTGIAFVLIVAGPPSRSVPRKRLAELIELPVHEALGGLAPAPNRVYVAPPDTVLRIEGGAFVVTPRTRDSAGLLRVDIFLRSLAADQRNRAIGVVLSGCAEDGITGRKTIKGEGGIAIAQKHSGDDFPTVPRGAIANDYVDLTLTAAQIGQELGRIARQLDSVLAHLSESTGKNSEEPLLAKIYNLLQKAKKVDFSFYKQTTLRRRIARRMVVKRLASLQEYVRYLQANSSEIKELYEDMLINVTRFFRDADTFAELRTDLLPLLLQDRPAGDTIRIWVPGCASGEEVYSLAITFLEHLNTVPYDIPIQLFGTDISEHSIEIARTAIYPEKLVTEISAERLQRFFIKVEGGYQVVKRVRDMCVFARQNLATDPPFSRLDLISCRNVLIYFGPTLQKTIIPTFHYALKPNGFLLLGTSETIRDYSNLFILLDKRHKFYAKNPAAGRSSLQITGRNVTYEMPELPHLERHGVKERWNEVELQRAADRIVLARFGPAGVVINEQGDILQSRGHTSPYLELPSGTATLSLLRMVKDNIAADLREVIGRAVAHNIPVRLEDLRQPMKGQDDPYTIEVLPILSQGQNTRCFLVLFIPILTQKNATLSPPLSVPQLVATTDDKDNEILQLRNDLASTKLYLQSLLEERDVANQELISANEEIQSSNEELQSINEELETAKEELQSTNEELQTVNEELFNRNEELGHTSNDLVNLLNNITVPVLMLDSELRIRQFTPIAERMMNVRGTDIGRPIGEIRLNLNLDNLETLLADVIDSLSTKELEVQDRTGRWHILRARPYRTADNKIDGVVLVLVEIDQIRKSQQLLMESRDFTQAVLAGVQVPLVVLDREFSIRMINRAFAELCERPTGEIAGQPFLELAARQWNLGLIRPQLEALLDMADGQAEFELEHESLGPNLQVLQINARAVGVGSDRIALLSIQNITVRKLAERLLRREKERLEGRVAVTELALDRTQEELRALAASLFRAQEEERRRVARELHDDLAQKVALLDLTTERIQQMQRTHTDASTNININRQVDELRHQITVLAQDLRRIAYQLHPPILDDLGLGFALKQLCEEFAQRENLPMQFKTRVQTSVPVTLGGPLYRITQEALRNIAKHAGKTAVEVSLTAARGELHLKITDHGHGFEPGEARTRGGMGILNMEERVRLVGGHFTLKTRPGKGATILVSVALPEAP